IKNLLADGEHAESTLDELQILLAEKRVGFLSDAIEYGLNNIIKSVNSPLWFGERNAYLETIDKIRDNLKQVKAEPESRDKNLEILTTDINEISRLINRLKGDEKRSRLRLPLQMILWGLPIVIGIWASGRLTFSQNILTLLFLFVIAALVFTASKFKLHSRISVFSRMAGYLKANTLKGMTLIQIPILIGAIGFMLIGPISDTIVKSRMEINVGETPQTLKKGSAFDLPFSIFYDHKSPAVGVKVKLSAPGILNNDLEKSFNVLTISSKKSGEFKVNIPADIPEGHYVFELTVSFDASRAITLPTIKKRGFHRKTESFEISIE
ncbi:MAG: hypothetical protein KAR20_10600, partial [Candidatus Heimdallarchaeota archaeon]|nr:hypothetical protein [Candidatus Heimdallarchaeota archaeon]